MYETIVAEPAPDFRSYVPNTSQSGLSLNVGSDGGRLLVIARVGDQTFALPASVVERVIRMAALTRLSEASPVVVGVLDMEGAILPAVDPRPRLGCPSPSFHPDQRLIVMSVKSRYLLWVDEVQRIALVQPQDLDVVCTANTGPLATYVARIDGMVIPVISPEVLDPGIVVQSARRRV